MNYNPYRHPNLNNYNIAVGDQEERVIPLLTGFALGAPFWGGLATRPRYNQVAFPFQPFPYPYPYPYPFNPYFRRRRRW